MNIKKKEPDKMNFSKIDKQSFFGKVLRFPLRLIPKRMVLPILQGRLRGTKWIVGAGEHGYWLGWYEMNKSHAFEREVKPGSVIYDIGANVGFFSLLAAELSGQTGQVYAFEPLPRNVEFLRKHVALNRIENVTVFEAAVSDRGGEAFFDLSASTSMGHLAETGMLKVQMASLDDLLSDGMILPPDFIKIDVEGAEFDVLNGAKTLFSTYRPVLFLDTHGREAHQAVIAFLEERDYRFEVLDGKPLAESKELVARPGTEALNR